MKDWQGKRYWIVGASEGLGRAVATKVSRAGARVLLSARSEDRLTELANELTGPAEVVPCDVSDPDSVARAAEAVGDIDGLIYLAGVYWPQPATEWSPEEVTAMADINFTGVCRVLGHVVPKMVARDAGHIVLTGSLSGFRGLPKSIGYAASKAGVMVLAEGMHADLKNTGVKVQLVNPGFVRTRLTEKNDFKMPQIMEPEAAAREVFEHISGDGFARNFPTGLATALRGMNLLPDALYFRIVS